MSKSLIDNSSVGIIFTMEKIDEENVDELSVNGLIFYILQITASSCLIKIFFGTDWNLVSCQTTIS